MVLLGTCWGTPWEQKRSANIPHSLPLPNPKARMHVKKSHWPHDNYGPKLPVTILKPKLMEGKATMGVYRYHVLLYTPQLGSRLGQNPRIYRSWCRSSSLCNPKSQLSLVGLVRYRSYKGPHLLQMSQWGMHWIANQAFSGFLKICVDCVPCEGIIYGFTCHDG